MTGEPHHMKQTAKYFFFMLETAKIHYAFKQQHSAEMHQPPKNVLMKKEKNKGLCSILYIGNVSHMLHVLKFSKFLLGE